MRFDNDSLLMNHIVYIIRQTMYGVNHAYMNHYKTLWSLSCLSHGIYRNRIISYIQMVLYHMLLNRITLYNILNHSEPIKKRCGYIQL